MLIKLNELIKYSEAHLNKYIKNSII